MLVAVQSSEPFSGGIGNYVNSTDNGVHGQTATLTFYETGKANPAPETANDVVGVGSADVNASNSTATFTVLSLPRNTVRAELEIYIKGNGCDEQWFASATEDATTTATRQSVLSGWVQTSAGKVTTTVEPRPVMAQNWPLC